MKIRILSIACVTTAAALLAACTAVYKNSDACEQLMRNKLAETSSDTLKIAHTGAGIDGSRVVVEGAIEHVITASEVAAASAASAATAASAARVANAPHAASGARAASAVSSASGASASLVGSPASASGAEAVSLKPAKPKKTIKAAAAECTFQGSALNVFSWLAPESLAAPANGAASEAAE
ncbi:hypothetical protein WN982_06715 [Paraburkholderia sp. IMGN_8]|uniref:hypothetical protein n=1 Tax=Paraburkholderia sp. IMGN_8 TaxID=3136564 RepID=UPI0031012392